MCGKGRQRVRDDCDLHGLRVNALGSSLWLYIYICIKKRSERHESKSLHMNEEENEQSPYVNTFGLCVGNRASS